MNLSQYPLSSPDEWLSQDCLCFHRVSVERPSASRRAGGRACSGSGGPTLATRARRRSARARRARSRRRGLPRGTLRSSSHHFAHELVTSRPDGENGLPLAGTQELDAIGLIYRHAALRNVVRGRHVDGGRSVGGMSVSRTNWLSSIFQELEI